jgi:membrane-associated protease RseP (regulator of RpoE activity)
VSSERPYRPEPPLAPDFERLLPPQDDVLWAPQPPARRFQHNYAVHLAWFGATFISATAVWPLGEILRAANSVMGPDWTRMGLAFAAGLWFSVPLLIILTAHEFGHYFACRYYNVDATLPYYIPFPFGLAGTLGAVIRIREPFPSKKALFDIGVAGPIAGFVALLPFLVVALFWWSSVGPMAAPGDLEFGEPVLFKILAFLKFGPIPAGAEIRIDLVGIAAWWGMLITFLNLLPFGQLDGGHVAYAVFGSRSKYVSAATLLAVVSLYLLASESWLVFALIMLGASVAFGFGHPFVVDEDAPLDRVRQGVAVFALLMLILCFMQNPISEVKRRPQVAPPTAPQAAAHIIDAPRPTSH